MITVLSHGKYFDKEAKYYRVRCSCGCDFICSKWDTRSSKCGFDKDKSYVECPDCKEKNYVSTSGFLMPSSVSNKLCINAKTIETLTQEEFNKLAGIEGEKAEEATPSNTEEE